MTLLLLRRLESSLSRTRLESYRINSCTDLEVLVNYYWNVALGEALYSSLHASELALRNSIHAGFSQRFGTNEWYDVPELLESNDLDAVKQIRDRADKENGNPTSNQMVSRLSYGFWTNMVSGKYDQRIWSPYQYAMVTTVFPYAKGPNGRQLGRNVLGKHYTKGKALRNRVAHFEQIFNSNRLIDNHAAIHEGISWIDPVLQSITESTDSFPDVYYNGKAKIRSQIQSFIAQGVP